MEGKRVLWEMEENNRIREHEKEMAKLSSTKLGQQQLYLHLTVIHFVLKMHLSYFQNYNQNKKLIHI